jgi:hypothetical protein
MLVTNDCIAPRTTYVQSFEIFCTHTVSLFKTSKSLFEFSVNGMPCSFFATFSKVVPGSNNGWIAPRTTLYNLCDNSTMDTNGYKK